MRHTINEGLRLSHIDIIERLNTILKHHTAYLLNTIHNCCIILICKSQEPTGTSIYSMYLYSINIQ